MYGERLVVFALLANLNPTPGSKKFPIVKSSTEVSPFSKKPSFCFVPLVG
jgi:hypothetical protein